MKPVRYWNGASVNSSACSLVAENDMKMFQTKWRKFMYQIRTDLALETQEKMQEDHV